MALGTLGVTGSQVQDEVTVVAGVMARPRLVLAIVAAAEAAGLTIERSVAEALIELWERARTEADGPARPSGRRIETLLIDSELYEGPHAVMGALMPDEQRAVPGSVHDALDRYTFGVNPDTGLASRGVIHTTDSTDHCAVVVAVVSA